MDSAQNPSSDESRGATTALQSPLTASGRVAPLWHTVILVVVLVGFSLAGASSQHTFAAHRGRMIFYGATMVWEWLLLAYVAWGARKNGVALRDLTGGRWSSPEDALLDVAIACGFWIVAMIVLAALAYALGMHGPGQVEEARRTLGFLAPHNRIELLMWFGLSATAGFCEEIIFRGYLQRQFAALTGVTALGVIAQSVFFGASHGYEGVPRMFIIAVYGGMFGLLTIWRRSLRPGMMAHALHDASAGVLFQFFK